MNNNEPVLALEVTSLSGDDQPCDPRRDVNLGGFLVRVCNFKAEMTFIVDQASPQVDPCLLFSTQPIISHSSVSTGGS